MSDLQHLSFLELLDLSLTEPRALAAIRSRYHVEAATLMAHFTCMSRADLPLSSLQVLGHVRAAAQAIRQTIEAHHGHIVGLVESTLSVSFATPRTALFAALDIQTQMAAFCRDRPDPHIQVGIGLGYGSVYHVPREALLGDAVQRARVLSRAPMAGGHLLASTGFRTALGSIPEGVGVHEANRDLVARVGIRFVEIRDYRD